MSVNIEVKVTTAGRAALVNAQNTGTAPVVIAEIGLSATAVVASAAATNLPGEFKRISGVGGSVVAADTIHITAMDNSTDAYSMRSFALYLANGTLFAIYGQADPLIVKTAGSAAGLAIDTIFADISAALLTFGNTNFLNPPATATTQGVVELATVAEAQAGIDALRALTPATAKAAILGWLLTVDGSGSGIDSDLLDGQDGTYYANVAARLGYNPVNRAGDIMLGLLSLSADPALAMHAVTKQYADALATAAAIRTKLLTVDGSGSGIDADLLDGRHASEFALGTLFDVAGNAASGRLSFGPFPFGTFSVTWRDHAVARTTAPYAYGNNHVYSSWARAWINGDDGDVDVSMYVLSTTTSQATIKSNANPTTGVLFSIGI